jgi:hypothetical protein
VCHSIVHGITVTALRGTTGVLGGHKSMLASQARIRIALIIRGREEFVPGIERRGHIGLCIGGVWTTRMHDGEIEGLNAGYRRGALDDS